METTGTEEEPKICEPECTCTPLNACRVALYKSYRPRLEMAKQYFEISGWNVIHKVFAKDAKTLLDDISKAEKYEGAEASAKLAEQLEHAREYLDRVVIPSDFYYQPGKVVHRVRPMVQPPKSRTGNPRTISSPEVPESLETLRFQIRRPSMLQLVQNSVLPDQGQHQVQMEQIPPGQRSDYVQVRVIGAQPPTSSTRGGQQVSVGTRRAHESRGSLAVSVPGQGVEVPGPSRRSESTGTQVNRLSMPHKQCPRSLPAPSVRASGSSLASATTTTESSTLAPATTSSSTSRTSSASATTAGQQQSNLGTVNQSEKRAKPAPKSRKRQYNTRRKH